MMRKFNRVRGIIFHYLLILIILAAVSSTAQCDDSLENLKNYAVYGYCFEENNGLCTTNTEIIVYANDRKSDNISTMVNLDIGMYALNLGNLENGWEFGENLTLILQREKMVSITTKEIQPTGPNNQMINLTFGCQTDYEMFNNQCYHKYDLNHDGIIISDYNDLIAAHKCFLGIEKNCKINYQDWQQIKQGYQLFLNQ